MSYDLRITVHHPDGYKTDVFDWSFTYNLRPMLDAAGLGESIRALDGKKAAEVQDLLYDVWHELRTQRTYYEAFNPANGWGSHKDLLPEFKKFYLATRLHPSGIIKVS